jgi:MOSC domain-containing protein YiiM
MTITHLRTAELEAGLGHIRDAPKDSGRVELIVRRPSVGAREVLDAVELDAAEGVKGDTWNIRASSRTPGRTPHPDMQLNVMSARAVALVAQVRERWALAGDQLYVDMDLSEQNLPPWTKLALGTAIIEVTDQPHTGCAKFVERFGVDAMKFVNSPVGRSLRLRGLNARVVQPGTVRAGDVARKL